jgi:hypothetical protein
MLQELIEAEATTRIGAEWNEHTETRTALRNGHRDKTLTTQAGDLDLTIPKLRSGSFFPRPPRAPPHSPTPPTVDRLHHEKGHDPGDGAVVDGGASSWAVGCCRVADAVVPVRETVHAARAPRSRRGTADTGRNREA